MLGKAYAIIVIISFISAIFNGKMSDVSQAAIVGAVDAIKFAVELSGIMCFWCGIMKLLERAGVIRVLCRIISPILRLLFPESYKNKVALEELSINISANILGLGNAATPMGLRAMEKLKGKANVASDDMVMLSVLNTTSVQLIPTTLIALRTMAGSENPYEIIMPIWIVSSITVIFAVAITKLFSKLKGR